MTCPTCVTLTRERDNARDLAAALEEELARRECDADRLPPKQPVIGLRAVFDWAEHLRTELARLWEGTDATPAKPGEVATDAQALHAMLEKSPEDRLNMLKLMRVEALADQWRYKGEFGWGPWQEGYGPNPEGSLLDDLAGGDS